jgi:hypothetical protein
MNRQEFLKALDAAGFDVQDGPPDAQVMLDLALEMMADIARLRAELDAAASTVVTSERGNMRADPRFAEIRAHTIALQKVLAALFPGDDSPTTVRARQAARVRWEATRR